MFVCCRRRLHFHLNLKNCTSFRTLKFASIPILRNKFIGKMSSSDVREAVKSLEDSLKCKVCNHLLTNPLLIVKCGHTTCKQCLAKHTHMTCPVCDVPVNTRDSLEDKQLAELLLQLKRLQDLLSAGIEEVKTTKVTSKVDSNSDRKHEPLTSTPKVQKTKLVSASVRSLSSEDSVIQETPENRLIRTPLSGSGQTKKVGNRKWSNSTTSPNTSMPSPLGNINKKNHKGETLLQRAVIKDDVTKVKELLAEGALVNTQDNNGWTPLHEASNRGFVELATLLLDHGALVNVPSLKDNITPLHDALLNDFMSMAILLVSRGADLHAKTSFGYTALDLCKTDGDRRILTEACSPFIQANTLIPDIKISSKEMDKIVFLCSNLDDKQKEKLNKCAQMLKADIVDCFKSEVTHVITSCDSMGNCTRTMKILMGVLTGKWLMNFQWIEVCLEYKQKVDEEVFEVQGTRNQPNTQAPKRGRQNYEQKCPALFDGFHFYLHGLFTSPTPSREDLCNLIHLGGGKLLSREPKPDALDVFMMPFHTASTPLEDTSHVILYQEKPPRDRHMRVSHICTTQVMWLVGCISEFKILEPKQTSVGNK